MDIILILLNFNKMNIDTTSLDTVKSNSEKIISLQQENELVLNKFLDEILFTGEFLFKNSREKNIVDEIQKMNLVCINENLNKNISNLDYFSRYPKNLFFVGENSITEINFIDTLKVIKEVKLVDVTKTQYVVELIFKSERVKLVKQKIKANKFRFIYSTFNSKVTCRRLTE